MARNRAGFTLLELAMVVVIIGIVLAVALPYFMPAIAFGELEASARHLANYGRAAMTLSVISRESYLLRVDLTNQEYWLVKLVEIEPEGEEGDEAAAAALNPAGVNPFRARGTKLFKDDSEGGGLFDRKRADEISSAVPSLGGLFEGLEDDAGEQAVQMQKRFQRFTRMQLMARAGNVKKDGILADVDPLFEKDFTLDKEEPTIEEQEVMDDLLARTFLPQGVSIDSIDVGGGAKAKGIVEVELTPLGLSEPLTFYLRSEDGDFYTVVWDPITGGAHLSPGRDTGA